MGISLRAIKRLFAVSGNQCAFPDCVNPLVLESGEVIGHICHIKARNPGGPRYDPEQTATHLHSHKNLILMCPTHHGVIDSDSESYSVQRLRSIKLAHESSSRRTTKELDDNAAQTLLDISFAANSVASLVQNNYGSGDQIAQQISNNLIFQSDNPNEFRDEVSRQQRNQHDLATFRRSDEILSELHLASALTSLLETHSYRDKFSYELDEYFGFFERASNQFIDKILADALRNYVESLNDLDDFLSLKFFDTLESQRGDNIRFVFSLASA
jgi:hypothetical protein